MPAIPDLVKIDRARTRLGCTFAYNDYIDISQQHKVEALSLRLHRKVLMIIEICTVVSKSPSFGAPGLRSAAIKRVISAQAKLVIDRWGLSVIISKRFAVGASQGNNLLHAYCKHLREPRRKVPDCAPSKD